MLSNIKKIVANHFTEHIMLYFFMLLCFSIGIATGVFSVKALSEIQKNKLIDYLLATVKSTLIEGQINNLDIFLNSIYFNMKTLIIIWILSISIFLFPIIFAVIGIRGFILGFTVGFLIENLGYRGILISTVSILPQSLLLVPGLLFLSVNSINYSTAIIKNKTSKKYLRNDNKIIAMKYTLGSLLIGIYLLFGSFIEGYISPLLLKGISQYIINNS